MASLNTVMNMNTKAVASLIQGNHSDCISTLQDALQIFKQSLNEQGEPTDVEMSSSSCNWTTQSFELPAVTTTCQESFQMFNSAFVFLWENTEGMDLPESEERVVPAILLYNLGLCHHREAIRLGDSDALRTASRLYSHAMALLETLTDELSEADMVLCAALANNMAHIASTVFDTKATQEFHQMLEEIMTCFNTEERLDEEDAEVFFCMNLLMASEIHLHAIAPAA